MVWVQSKPVSVWFCSVLVCSVLQQWASRLIHTAALPCLRDGTLPSLCASSGSSPMMPQAGSIGNLVLRRPRITMMEGIWAALCQAYEILSIHTGSCQAFLTTLMFSIWVWRAELKPANPLCIVCVCVHAHVCVCAQQTNGYNEWDFRGEPAGLESVAAYVRFMIGNLKAGDGNTTLALFVCSCWEIQRPQWAAVVISVTK